jgi:hypothetical protein
MKAPWPQLAAGALAIIALDIGLYLFTPHWNVYSFFGGLATGCILMAIGVAADRHDGRSLS